LQWQVGAFHTVNEDDILFQTTGGATANVGFFDNVGDTRRAGLELSLSQRLSRLHWFIEYSLIEATFEEAFVVNSPNHPVLEQDPDASQIVGEDKLLVRSGATIPGIPRHQGNVGMDFFFNDRFSLGADVVYRSGVYLRGDEVNLLDKTDSYAILNLRGEYRIGERIALFARIENALDEEYETFGLLGEPDEVFEDFEDPRFFGAGPPFGAWVGFKVKL
jgi:outer membrane receptor protein involved in Fe transport